METGTIQSSGAVSYSPSVVTMALPCIVYELLGENREIFIPNLYLWPRKERPCRHFAKVFDSDKTRVIAQRCSEETMTIC